MNTHTRTHTHTHTHTQRTYIHTPMFETNVSNVHYVFDAVFTDTVAPGVDQEVEGELEKGQRGRGGTGGGAGGDVEREQEEGSECSEEAKEAN